MDCFGSDSEEESSSVKRDASCGVCSFHPHTETSLLCYVKQVRNSVASKEISKNNSINDHLAKIRKAEHVLQAVDAFCTTRHWMMHIGPEKGDILTRTLKESIDRKLSSQQSDKSFIIVELGSYCGYSSILMAKECISYNNKLKFKLITLEINPEYHAIASEMIKLSGLDDMISIFEISYNGYHTNIVDLLREELKQNTIDMLFIDHDKDSYKSDLIRLEEAEFLRQGSRVVADNVIFAQIHDFVDYVQHRQKNGVVKTETVSCSIEYSNDGSNSLSAAEETSDGIGEFKHCFVLNL